MLWVLRIPIMLMCAEWLLFFRRWLAPSVFLLLCAAAALRIGFLYFLPSWDGMTIAVLFGIMPLAILTHLKAIFNGRSRAERHRYSLPATGAPWLLKATNSPRLSLLLEFIITTTAVLVFYAYGSLIYPQGMHYLPPEWTAWLRQNGAYFANQFSSVPIFGLMFWGILHFSRQSPWLAAAPGYQYQGVRAHSHSLPSLPSVKELADEYKQQYG